MPRKGYYSPILRRELVTRMYHAARALGVPMTVLNDRLIEDALNRIVPVSSLSYLPGSQGSHHLDPPEQAAA